MSYPIERLASLTIGSVDSVSPAEIKVVLDIDAPQATALNSGSPSGFPRINGYILIPNENGALVGFVVWLGVERSPFPRRPGLKDFGLIDLPFPLRRLAATPVGNLKRTKAHQGITSWRLERGVSVFPSVGDTVLLPTAEQLKGIIEASDPSDRRVQIGTSPLSSNSTVSVDPNKLFGRHLAVLGNTGSGKSCTVAGLIRWSLESAASSPAPHDRRSPNARFIILDLNGEYTQAFTDLSQVRIFKVPPISPAEEETSPKPLALPAWMWNSYEWGAFAHAAPNVQRPMLLQALRNMRAGNIIQEPLERQVGRLFRSYRSSIQGLIAQGIQGYTGFPQNKNCGESLKNLEQDALRYADRSGEQLAAALQELATNVRTTWTRRRWSGQSSEGFSNFSETDLFEILDSLDALLGSLAQAPEPLPISEDAPIRFDVDALPDHLEQLASDSGLGQAAQFVATLTMRIRMMLADRRIGPVVNEEELGRQVSLEDWLAENIGANRANNGQIAILDLSLMPSDILHMVVAVTSRLIFEAVQRYRRHNGNELPTVLVLEEAHAFVHKGEDGTDGLPTPAQMCRQVFEKIAREGRKFGLGLVLSSQRPHELSPTVLAQCNTFLLHRIVNDRDQELVSRLVPDNLAGLLKELPSLPSRQAVLLGWAASIPVLVEIKELPEEHRPRSNDPKFWEVWTGTEEREIDWASIVQDWSGEG